MPIRYLTQEGKSRTTLTYQRRWPTHLSDTAKATGNGTFCKTNTGLALDASLTEQEQAVVAGNAEWERQCSLLKAYQARAEREEQGSGITWAGSAKALGLINKRNLSKRAADIAKRSQGKTLASALDMYWKARNVDPATVNATKSTRERQRYWDEWVVHLEGDYVLIKRDPKAIDSIQNAFDAWQEEMQGRGVKSSTVARARSAVITVIQWLSQEYRLGWHVELKTLPATKRTAKAVLSVEEQRRLLRLIAEQPSETTAMIAVMLAGGVMPSEIKRMDPDAVVTSLLSVYPHVVVGAGDVDVKAEARRRFVPIVWDAEVLEVVREYLPQAIRSLENTTDPAARVNKWLRTRDFKNITGHRLRDTMAAAAGAAMANPIALARVGGWSGAGLNTVMLGYGAGAEGSELLRSLTEECRRWWASAIAPDGGDDDKVVPLRREA
jgi:integrase